MGHQRVGLCHVWGISGGSLTLGTSEEGHKVTCIPGVGAEIPRDVLRRSCGQKFLGGGNKQAGLCPLPLSTACVSAQTARWEVKRGSGEGLRGQTAAVSGMRRVSEGLSVCLRCSAAKHCLAAEREQQPRCSIPARVLLPGYGRILLLEGLSLGRGAIRSLAPGPGQDAAGHLGLGLIQESSWDGGDGTGSG